MTLDPESGPSDRPPAPGPAGGPRGRRFWAILAAVAAVGTAGIVVLGVSSTRSDPASFAEPTTSAVTSATATSSSSPTAAPTTTARRRSHTGDGESSSSTPTRSSTSTSSGSESCTALSGTGTYAHPFDLGDIDALTTVTGCEPLTPGAAYDHRYFSFTLTTAAGTGARAGVRFTLMSDQPSAVHVRILNGALTVRRDEVGIWIGGSPATGRYQNISGLRAGTYLLSADKLDSPSRPSTPEYSVFVDPG